tara:strand:- start:2430 stop:2777 length:348 start_codon:yes stop_codon:yes gene_type:complete
MKDIDNMSLKDMDKLKGTPKSNVPFDPAWKGSAKRWQAYRTGDLYVLQVVNRTTGHKFQVHQYGKNAWQAALRYYRGFQGHGKRKRDGWVWICTKVVSASLYQPDPTKLSKVLTA